jgi:hypothetical protein
MQPWREGCQTPKRMSIGSTIVAHAHICGWHGASSVHHTNVNDVVEMCGDISWFSAPMWNYSERHILAYCSWLGESNNQGLRASGVIFLPKNTNISRLCKKGLIIRGDLCSVIYHVDIIHSWTVIFIDQALGDFEPYIKTQFYLWLVTCYKKWHQCRCQSHEPGHKCLITTYFSIHLEEVRFGAHDTHCANNLYLSYWPSNKRYLPR